jgi:hypothetical protein
MALSYGGIDTWLEVKIKQIKSQLKGTEAKGVDIINIFLLESQQNHSQLGQWVRIINSFNYMEIIDLQSFVDTDPLVNAQRFISLASQLMLNAPWPQVHAIGKLLEKPLDRADLNALQLCMNAHQAQWRVTE